MAESKFDRLKNHIAREYEAKGIPPEKAQAWGAATAGKVAKEKGDEPGKEETDGGGTED